MLLGHLADQKGRYLGAVAEGARNTLRAISKLMPGHLPGAHITTCGQCPSDPPQLWREWPHHIRSGQNRW